MGGRGHLQPPAWRGVHAKLLGLPVKSYTLAHAGFRLSCIPQGGRSQRGLQVRWQHGSWRGGRMGTPSVCHSPGSLELGFTQHVPRGCLQARTPVRSHWPAPLGSPTPVRGVSVGHPAPGRSQAGRSPPSRELAHWDVRPWTWSSGPHCSHRRPGSRRPRPAEHTGLGRQTWTTPRFSGEDLYPTSGPPLSGGSKEV